MSPEQIPSATRAPETYLTHAAVQAVVSALATHRVEAEVVSFSEPAHTAAIAAQALGIDVGQIANSLIFNADGGPLLVLTSGAHRVDTAKLAATLGKSTIKRADAAFVKAHTGQTIGGVAPLGHPQPIETVVDTWLSKYDAVWAAAGHTNTVFATSYAELLQVTGGTPADVA
ncbi:prolyl-tRNA editing enzyme YbaK/EbsC (Cys-tRNA(Pro) deacylase) [Antricoccus suffuscus]|uniref:Prolyl-tRNA editing enzyme YbaK/EbsC (Cys-tRNA(Pro) deacylase) n=1 Tax=Antricoccus suffuscus TaxID=1629062 RepID=A0A2T0ZZ82_9ACTN|nr:YbaK/EbsC family protein [Antricoccus suffuscus]PRZ41398.1 prolyl-tRNA editing enzyme YbaK/EbsC (Cys-tRNA(Pro) deacylase) [Antricoccus suffuscus]